MAPERFRTTRNTQLIEHSTPDYTQQTNENAINCDATLIFATTPESNDTELMIQYCAVLID
jgi:hypothetical protein